MIVVELMKLYLEHFYFKVVVTIVTIVVELIVLILSTSTSK